MTVCPIIDAFVKVLDARMPPPMRKELHKYDRLVAGSAVNPGVARLRAYIAADLAVREATAIAMAIRGHDPRALCDMPEIVDYETAIHAAGLASDVAMMDEAVYCAWSSSIAAQLVTKDDALHLASDAAAYAYYLAAAATSGALTTDAWENSLYCLESMLEVR
jgi:hypothetical protein